MTDPKQNNQTVEYRDYRTSLTCKLLHPIFEQIMRVVGDTPYPNICYRCEPDLYMEEPISQMTLRRKCET